MAPSLLPLALLIIAVLLTALVLFLRWYRMVQPGTALIITAEQQRPRVLLQGGRFVGPGNQRVESLDMTERQLAYSFDGRQVTLLLRPKESETDVLAIVGELGVSTANDLALLTSALESKVRAALAEADPDELHAAVMRALPSFDVTSAQVSTIGVAG